MAEENKLPGFKWVRSKDNIPEIYSNFTHSSWTLFDIRVRFGQLVPTTEDKSGFVVEERAAVTFSWNQAKNVRDLLTQLIDSFEKVNGEIKPLKLAPDPFVDKTGAAGGKISPGPNK